MRHIFFGLVLLNTVAIAPTRAAPAQQSTAPLVVDYHSEDFCDRYCWERRHDEARRRREHWRREEERREFERWQRRHERD